jgi:hypothetical protein
MFQKVIFILSFIPNTRSTLDALGKILLFRGTPFENHCPFPSSRNVLEQILATFYITIFNRTKHKPY